MKKIALTISILLIAVAETGCYTTEDIVPPYAQSMGPAQSGSDNSARAGSYSQSQPTSSGSQRRWVNGHYSGSTWVRGHFEG